MLIELRAGCGGRMVIDVPCQDMMIDITDDWWRSKYSMGHKTASDKLRDSRDTQTRHGRKQMCTGQPVSMLLQNMCCIV